MAKDRPCLVEGREGTPPKASSFLLEKVAEREGIEPTKDRLPFNGFENRGDHQARSTLHGKAGRHLGGRQMNEFDLMIFLNRENLSFQELT